MLVVIVGGVRPVNVRGGVITVIVVVFGCDVPPGPEQVIE